MKKNRIIITSVLTTFLLIGTFLLSKTLLRPTTPEITAPVLTQESPKLFNQNIGEKLIYEVKLGKITIGKSTFTRLPNATANGKIILVMTFETNVTNFKDTETIYTDAVTFLPLKIERNITNWLSKEKITEEYNQSDFTLHINKRKGSNTETMVIKKDGPIHNAILLPQQIRYIDSFKPENAISANLPNRKFEIKMVGEENVEVPAGKYKAYKFESTPKQIAIWISADTQKVPLKIQGTGFLGYLMVLKERIAP